MANPGGRPSRYQSRKTLRCLAAALIRLQPDAPTNADSASNNNKPNKQMKSTSTSTLTLLSLMTTQADAGAHFAK
ncbi:hypothetical protein AWZ03_010887 [Drosophila navojoa]|uniref:Uncharacterized protein n=1 Tax=Drosophila navojoa TaxID=7232 RepID=A0A484B250_DRONA|nr:hypothetical protein AWZ03_010887 [Drosophila navojoa]